ncbi:hypothetical protein SK128_020019 [Halocaridina rubra]|uniref:SHSP domain-containing protein n=1 Tax=Halocaridina rubra TaxID=373956 RepID=A0AAN8ZXQ2_HALRR
MAPIQNKSSSSSSSSYSYKKSSTSNHESTPRRDHEPATESAWESSFLPITRRGRFFQDSFFENTRSHFDDAVREALQKFGDDSDFFSDNWNNGSSKSANNFSRYRQMRSQSIDEDNLAVTVTSDSLVHKIVLDVHDFKEGDLKVKVVGDRELLVEGTRAKKDEGASAISTQKFSRRFSLPLEVDVAAIDSVMSSDGVLTITAPKRGRIGNTSKCHEAREPCDCDKCNPKLKSREPKSCHSEKSQSPVHNTSKEGTRERSEQRESRCQSSSIESNSHKSLDVPINAFFNSRPITKRGRFFDDSYFADTRSGFRSAIQDVLSKWGESSSNVDDLTSYRNLRTRDLREDNQAVQSMEDEIQHKFIIDVHDFMKDGEINVKAVDDQELVVEGKVVKQEGASKSIKKFSRRFLLPADVHLESVSSVMSSDGILTIIAPKKNAVQNQTESHHTLEAKNDSYSKCNEDFKDYTAGTDTYDNNDQYVDRSVGASSTTSTADNTLGAQEETVLHSSVTSKVYKAEEVQKPNESGGHNISIRVEDADEDLYMGSSAADSKVMNEKASQAYTQIHRDDDMDSNPRSVRERSTECLDAHKQSARRSMEDMEIDERSARGSSMNSFNDTLRSSRERCMDFETGRFDHDFDMDDDDSINFQDNFRHTDVSEKKLRSILKKPTESYQEEDDRHSRERSYLSENQIDSGRTTPNREYKKASGYTPLNPNGKRTLPISIRGHFISDPYFTDFQDNFKAGISDVLSKFNEKSASLDNTTAYRNLRFRDPKLENQAFHVQEDQGAHKVVLDVRDFLSGQIEAAVYDESELVIEGKAERVSGTSITTLSFLRRFPLPENADTDAITVVMSVDGVLTVVTPWKGRSGLSAIKNILSQDRSLFDRHSDFDRHWDDEWHSSRRDSDDFMSQPLNSRIRSRFSEADDDFF